MEKLGKAYFHQDDMYIDFDNEKGILSAGAHEPGYFDLSEEDTKLLFLSMMNYYLAEGAAFWRMK